MLELALYVVIFEFLDRFFSKSLKKKLTIEESSTKRILIRRKVKRNRIILLTCFVFFLIGTETFNIYSAITHPYDRYSINSCFLFPVICFMYFKFLKKWRRIQGNISTSDLQSFNYVNSKYSLFLRGFDNDDYRKIDELENPKTEKYDRLSEYWFFKLLSKKYNLPVVSVGMTKELDSPLGTKRIYLDDTEWRTGVRTLMENADKIIILVNDRESCIWEISQTATFLNKTIYIADNAEKYNIAREKVSEIIDLPPLQLTNDKCAVIPYGTATEVQYFDNSRMGYSEMLGVKYTPTKSKRKGVVWGCVVSLVVMFVSIIVVVIVNLLKSNDKDSSLSNIELVDPVYISPFDEVRTVVELAELPMNLGCGMTMIAIEILEEARLVSYTVEVDEDEIDMELLKLYAKSNMLMSIETGNLQSPELQFCLYCMNNNITLEYNYLSKENPNNKFAVSLTVEDLSNAFQSRNDFKTKSKSQ